MEEEEIDERRSQYFLQNASLTPVSSPLRSSEHARRHHEQQLHLEV